MQNFAINGGALNGDPEVWIDDSAASVELQAAGAGMRGAMGAGTAQCSIVSTAALALHARLEGVAGVALASSGSIAYGASLVGAAPLQVNASLQGLRWVMLAGDAPTEFYLDGDLQVVPAISATFVMTMASDLDLHVATGRHIDGYTPIEFRSSFDAIVAKAARLEGYAPIQFAGIGYPALTIQSPAGAAMIQMQAGGDTRQGSRIMLEGCASVETYVRGEISSFSYSFLEGDALIVIKALASHAAAPAIPSEYSQAPSTRTFRVGREMRDLRVHRDGRSFG